METLDSRLQELERTEITLTTAWAEIIKKRKLHDLKLSQQREAEDVRWRERLESRDREEDPVNLGPKTREACFEQRRVIPFTSKLIANSAQTPPAEAIPDSTARVDKGKNPPKAPRTDKRYGVRNPDDDRYMRPSGLGSKGEPLYTRLSDGVQVTLKCCVAGCDKSHFNTVLGLRMHVARAHNVKDRFQSMAQAVEKCGVPVVEEESDTNGDNVSGTLIRPIEVESDPELHSVKAERGMGAEPLPDWTITSEIKEHTTENDRHQSPGLRAEPHNSNRTAMDGEQPPEMGLTTVRGQDQMLLSESSEPAKNAIATPESSSEYEPLAKRVRRRKNWARMS
ncbi:hypothetical protein MMC32_002765 [Xylographa parallela]|nr:hypothetical protein [Xylographa parallela]